MRLLLVRGCVAVAALAFSSSILAEVRTTSDAVPRSPNVAKSLLTPHGGHIRKLGKRSDLATDAAVFGIEQLVAHVVEKEEVRKIHYYRARREIFQEHWAKSPVSVFQVREEDGELELMKRQKEEQAK